MSTKCIIVSTSLIIKFNMNENFNTFVGFSLCKIPLADTVIAESREDKSFQK